MSEQKVNSKADNRHDWQIILKTAMYGVVILAAGMFGSLFIEKALSNSIPKFADDIRIAAVLFLIWLVVNATIKAADKVKHSIEGWKLIILGTGIAVIGSFIFTVIKGYFPDLIWNTSESIVFPFEWNKFFFYSAIGFVLSLTSVIRLRVGSKFWGKILIYAVYAAILILVYLIGK